jgi:hypothetical protein
MSKGKKLEEKWSNDSMTEAKASYNVLQSGQFQLTDQKTNRPYLPERGCECFLMINDKYDGSNRTAIQ